MHLLPWSQPTSAGFTLRGWHSAPSGKSLLHFLHGNGFCGRAYEPLLDLLARDFDLWLCDAQGHGDSDHGGRFCGWNRSAELALEAFHAGRSRFGEVPRFACGHSFGGVLTGLLLAAEPQLFRRAVLLDPVLFPPGMLGMMAVAELLGLHERRALVRQARGRRARWRDRAAAWSGLHERGIFRGWSDAALRAYIEHGLRDVEGGVELKCRPSREAEIFASYPRRLWRSLARVETPTLVLRGADSYPFVVRGVARYRALNPQVGVQVLAGGHCFMQEDPQEATERIRAFLLVGDA